MRAIYVLVLLSGCITRPDSMGEAMTDLAVVLCGRAGECESASDSAVDACVDDVVDQVCDANDCTLPMSDNGTGMEWRQCLRAIDNLPCGQLDDLDPLPVECQQLDF